MDILMKILVAWGFAAIIIVPVIDADRRRLEREIRQLNLALSIYRSQETQRIIDDHNKSYEWESGL